MGRERCMDTEWGCGKGSPAVGQSVCTQAAFWNHENHGQNMSLKLFPNEPNEQEDKACSVHLAAKEDRLEGIKWLAFWLLR